MILQLKELLKEQSVTSIELANRLGVTKTTVSLWINGKVFPNADTLECIAELLNVPVWRLFGGPEDDAVPTSTNTNSHKCPHCGGIINIKLE